MPEPQVSKLDRTAAKDLLLGYPELATRPPGPMRFMYAYLDAALRELDAQDKRIAALEAERDLDSTAQEELDKLLSYAREVNGSRDVHSVYEVLDLVKQLKAERDVAIAERDNWRDTSIEQIQGLLRERDTALADLREAMDALDSWEHRESCDHVVGCGPCSCSVHDTVDLLARLKAAYPEEGKNASTSP